MMRSTLHRQYHKGVRIASENDNCTSWLPLHKNYPWTLLVRYAAGVMPTKYTYTGQYSYTEGFGLMFYNARWFDPAVGRFAQGDTIVPEGGQGLDRYAYVNNNPLRYVDASGHDVGCAGYDALLCGGGNTTIAGDTRIIEGIRRERMRFGYDPDPESTIAIIYQRLKLPHPQITLYYYREALTPEPIIKSSSTSSPTSIIDVDIYVNWAQVDEIQALIDVLGIGGDIALIIMPEGPGEFAEVIISAVEYVDAIKAISDAFGGDFSGLSIVMIVQYLENNPLVVARGSRWVPLFGSIGSGHSLYKNFYGNLNINVTCKSR